MSASSPRSNVLLRELQEKLDALKKKKEMMIEYYGETKGHSYRRDPQLEKLDRAIYGAEQEIALMDPNPRRQKRGGSGKQQKDGDEAMSASTKAGPSDSCGEHSDTQTVESAAALLLTWVLDSMTSGGRVDRRSQTNSQGNAPSTRPSSSCVLLCPDADDSNFFAWLVGSMSDPYITVAATKMDQLPSRWLSNVIRLAPCQTAEVLTTPERRALALRAISSSDQWLLMSVLSALSPNRHQLVSAVGLTFEHRLLSGDEKELHCLIASSITQLVTSGWGDAFRTIYFSDDFRQIADCAAMASEVCESHSTYVHSVSPLQTSLSVAEPALEPSNRAAVSSAAATRKRPATAAERWASTCTNRNSPTKLPEMDDRDAPLVFPTLDAEDVRSDERRRFALSHAASRMAHGQRRFQTFLRLPSKIVHCLLASMHRCIPHVSSTLAVDPFSSIDDAHAIFDLTSTVLSATGTSTAVAQDQHSCDLLRDPLWVRHHLKRAATERRRQCSLSLDRTSEERFWSYFLEEQDRSWTEGVDEHVLAAFVLGRTRRGNAPHRAKSPELQLPQTAIKRKSVGMAERSASVETENGGAYLALATESNAPAAYALQSGNAPIHMQPEVCCESFNVEGNFVHQLSPAETLVQVCDDGNGVRAYARNKLNLRADAPAGLDGAFCFECMVPVSDEARGTYRVGWATKDFVIGVVEQDAPRSNLGDDFNGFGASFSFEPFYAHEEGGRFPSSRQALPSQHRDSGVAPFSRRHCVVLSYWHGGVHYPRAASIVVDGLTDRCMLSQHDDSKEQTMAPGGSSTSHAEIICMLNVSTSSVSFAIADEIFENVACLTQHSSTAGAPSFWFPASTLGIRNGSQADDEVTRSTAQQQPEPGPAFPQSPVRKPNGSPKKSRNRASSPKSAPLTLAGADSSLHQATKKVSPPLTWKFMFLESHYDHSAIPPSNRLLDMLHCLLHYGAVVDQFRIAVDQLADDIAVGVPCPPRPTSSQHAPQHRNFGRRSLSPPNTEEGSPSSMWDVLVPYICDTSDLLLKGHQEDQYKAHLESARLRSFLSDFVQLELRVQFNALEELPAVLVPKVLDVDDVLELVMGGEHCAQALQHLRISDRTLMRASQRPDRDRDDRWFPHLARPAVKTKSRFGSMAAMKRSASHEQWNLLVDSVDGLRCPPLHAALLLGHREAVALLIRSPLVDVDAVDSQGNTPLIYAAQLGLTQIVEHLVFVREANVSLQNASGLNALHVAIVNHQLGCLDILLRHPTAVNDNVLNVLTRGKSNAVSIATKLHRSDLVALFIARGAQPWIADNLNVTPLCFALRCRDTFTASCILAAKYHVTKEQINIREKRNPRGTALLYAANMGETDIVDHLLNLGADPSVQFYDPHCNVLHLAVASARLECLNRLLAVFSIADSAALTNGSSFGRGATPLHLAAEMGDGDMMAALCRCGTVDVNAADSDGKTPLMVLMSSAAYTNEATAVSITHLIKRKLRVDQADKAGRTTLFYAVARGAIGVMRILVEGCKASVNEIDMWGFTPLTFALAHNQDAAAECLLHISGGKINFLVARPNVPQPIDFAYSRGSVTVCRLILELGERCTPELRSKILSADNVVASGQLGSWGDRRLPMNASIDYRPFIAVYGNGIVHSMQAPLQSHGTCASALLSWHSSHSGDPQHRRVSASCFGVAATVRPTAAERVAHRVLDLTACGDDAIAVLQRLELGELAIHRRGQMHYSSPTKSDTLVNNEEGGLIFSAARNIESASPEHHHNVNHSMAVTTVSVEYSECHPNSEAHDAIMELDTVFSMENAPLLQGGTVVDVPIFASPVASPQTRSPPTTFLISAAGAYGDGAIRTLGESSRRKLLHPDLPIDQLVSQLIDAFRTFMPEVKTERALRLASTQVLLLLVEARTNAARHAYLPICHGGYEMSTSRLESLAFQALQLNREPTVVAELQAIVRLSESNPSLEFNVNVQTQSKWGGRNVTMLHMAVLAGNASAAQFLLSVGADPLIDVHEFEYPAAVADFESLSADSVTSRDFSSSSNATQDRSPMFVRIPSPLLCALRLGDERVTLAILRHIADKGTSSGNNAHIHLFVPREEPVRFSNAATSLVFESQRVPLLHCVAVLCPHHDWESSTSLVAFWRLLEGYGAQLNVRCDAASGMTALQLAITCGRSDFVEWALQRKRGELVSIAANATAQLNVERVVQLFDALGIRCVALAGLEWLRQQQLLINMQKRTPPEAESSDSTEGVATCTESVHQCEETVEVNIIDLAFVCCPSAVCVLQDFGFEAPVLSRPMPQSEPLRNQRPSSAAYSGPTPPSSSLAQPRLQRRSGSSTSRNASSAAPKRSPPPRTASTRSPPPRKQTTIVAPSESSAHLSVQWKGTSTLHLALRALLRVPVSSSVSVLPQFSRSNSPLLLGSSRTFNGSCLHFMPSALVERQDFGRYIADGVSYILRSFNNRIQETLDTIAAQAANQDNDAGDPSSPLTVVAIANSSFPALSNASTVSSAAQLIELDIGLFAADVVDGNTPLHSAAQSGNATVLDALFTAGDMWITAIAKQIVPNSTRAPHASAQAQVAKALEMKTAAITARNKIGHQSVLDIMLTKDMTDASWFQCVCTALEWLPQGSAVRIGYAEKLGSRVHPLVYSSVALSSGLLSVLVQQHQLAQQPSIEVAKKPILDVIMDDEKTSRVVTLVFTGLLFSTLCGKQRVTWDTLRKVLGVPSVCRTLMERINPCLAALLLSTSTLSSSAYRVVQHARQSSVITRDVSHDRSAQQQQQQSIARKASLAPVAPGKPQTASSRPLLGSPTLALFPPGPLEKLIALCATHPFAAVGDVVPSSAFNSITTSERCIVTNFIPPSQYSPGYDVIFNDNPPSSYRPTPSESDVSASAGGWRSSPLVATIAEAMDDLACLLWNFTTSCALEKRATQNNSVMNPSTKQADLTAKDASTSPSSTAHQEQDSSRERLCLWFVTAAHFGMQSVFIGAWYRIHVGGFAVSEADRATTMETLLYDRRILAAACRAKRSIVLMYLVNCGALNVLSHRTSSSSEAATAAAARPIATDGIVLVNEVFRRLRCIDDVVERDSVQPQKKIVDVSQPQRPAFPPSELLRCAARQCLRVLFYGRCTISELTIQHILSNPDLYHINEVTAVHHDSLLHLAIMNRALEAIVALAHAKKFTIGAWRNVFGLQAWEYATDSITIGHALNKRNPSMHVSNLSVAHYAAVAILADGAASNAMSMSRLDMSTSDVSSRRSKQPQHHNPPVIPPLMVQALQDLMFVVEEDGNVEIGSKSTPVLKVTLPAAVVASRLTATSTTTDQMQPSPLNKPPRQVAVQQGASANDRDVSEVFIGGKGWAVASVLRDCDHPEARDCVVRERAVLHALTEAMTSQAQRSVSEIVLTDVSTRLAPVEDRYGKRSGADRGSARRSGNSGDATLGMSRRPGLPAMVAKIPLWMGEDDGLQVCIMPMYS